MDEITCDDLSQDQKIAHDAIVNGQNAILLGEGGSGKSTVANLAINELTRRKLNVMVCAPTAIAALNLGGTTCHRVFGLHLCPETSASIHKADQIPFELWCADVISIDEISMMTCDFSDAWNAPGLIYVGLSRARSIEGVSLVSSINPWTLACSPMVANFYRQIDPTFDYVHGLDIETNIDEYARAVRAGIPPIDVKAYVDAWANQARVFGKWIDQPAEK